MLSNIWRIFMHFLSLASHHNKMQMPPHFSVQLYQVFPSPHYRKEMRGVKNNTYDMTSKTKVQIKSRKTQDLTRSGSTVKSLERKVRKWCDVMRQNTSCRQYFLFPYHSTTMSRYVYMHASGFISCLREMFWLIYQHYANRPSSQIFCIHCTVVRAI